MGKLKKWLAMQKYRWLIFIVGVFLTAIVCWDIYTWIVIAADKSRTFEEVKEIYFSRFPEAFRHPILTTFIEIAILLPGTVCFFQTKNYKDLRIVSWALFWFDTLIICWLLFTLM